MSTVEFFAPDKETIERTVRRFLHAVRAEYGDRLRSAYFFGSRARGDNEPDSDVDLALVVAGSWEYPTVTDFLSKVSWQLMMETGVVIDAQPLTEAEWENPLQHYNPVLVEEIRHDARRIDLD